MRSFFLLSLALLAGCAGLDERAPGDRIEFELSGRLAVRYRDEAASGNLTWRHAQETDDMLITTPLGTSVARIARSGGTVVLTTSEGREYRATDAESLTAQVLGFRVPLEGLSDWVRGRPVAGQAHSPTRDPQGRLATLEQSGWRIEYQAFRPDGRPSRMKLDYPGIELRLAIHDWAPEAATGEATANGAAR